MDDTTTDNEPVLSREEIIAEVARLWAEGVADQNARTPEEAAQAAGKKDNWAAAWIAQYRPTPGAAA